MTNPQPVSLAGSKLLAPILDAFNTQLLSGLSWLDNAYNRAEKLATEKNGRRTYFPAVFVGRDFGANPVRRQEYQDYLSMMPDEKIASYCWWDFPNGEQLNSDDGVFFFLEADFGLVFVVDLQKVYPDPTTPGHRGTEEIKAAILGQFATPPAGLAVSLSDVQDRVENVYRGYSWETIDPIAWMDPYYLVRINGTLKTKAISCSD